MILPRDSAYFLGKLRQLHIQLRDYLRDQLVTQDPTVLASVTAPREGDTIYRIDERGEDVILEFCRDWAWEMPFALVAEGFPGDGWHVLPEGTPHEEAAFLLVMDPIDGTRPLMYDKRSAWILTGIAPNLGKQTTLGEITIAMQTEIPTTRQYLAYHLWAVKGLGAKAEIHDLVRNTVRAAPLNPSRATDLDHGFSSFAKFFPSGKSEITYIENLLFSSVLGDIDTLNPLVFDDQYTSSGGQLFELMVGHDRFIADIRPIVFERMKTGLTPLCAHPYDLCTELIAREAGVSVTDGLGNPLRARLDIRENVSWIGYANSDLRDLIEPRLLEILRRG